MMKVMIAAVVIAMGTAMVPGTSSAATQQEKMKKCNADAAGKTGADRKAFMSSCMKG